MPKSITFRGSVKEEFSQVVSITPSKKYPFALKEISMNSDLYVDAKLIPPADGEDTWKIEVKNKMKEAGRYFEIIRVSTDSEFKPEIKIRVYAMLIEEVVQSTTGS